MHEPSEQTLNDPWLCLELLKAILYSGSEIGVLLAQILIGAAAVDLLIAVANGEFGLRWASCSIVDADLGWRITYTHPCTLGGIVHRLHQDMLCHNIPSFHLPLGGPHD